MYRLEREQFLHFPYVPYWAMLGFQAGFINAFGFIACGRFVSHVTGFGTQIGLAVASSSSILAIELLGFPVSFILGSFVSSVMTSVKIDRGIKPKYDLVTLLMPFILLSLMLLSHFGAFGIFGDQLVQDRDFALLFLLAFVCGMQNGCFATLTKGQIRTTHLTGISTDLGTDLARTWFGRLSPLDLHLTKTNNFVRIATLLAFTIGSIFSVIVCQKYGFMALIVPTFTSIIIFFGLRKIQSDLDLKLGPFKKSNLEKTAG